MTRTTRLVNLESRSYKQKLQIQVTYKLADGDEEKSVWKKYGYVTMSKGA